MSTDIKSILIVTGVARSGTTAFAELVNSHPEACLGIERFKFRFLRHNSYDPALFERDRFFDFRPRDTNLDPARRPAWKPVYDTIAAKWDGARIVGDKVPDLIPVLDGFIATNPDFRYICLLRNLKDVALSWQARADRDRDAWPKGKDFGAACESWAAQMRQLHEVMRDRDLRRKILLVDYDAMYEDVATTEAALLAFLGLPPDPAFRATLASHAEFMNTRPRRKLPEQFVDAYKAVEQGHIRGLRKIAREQADQLAAGPSHGSHA